MLVHWIVLVCSVTVSYCFKCPMVDKEWQFEAGQDKKYRLVLDASLATASADVRQQTMVQDTLVPGKNMSALEKFRMDQAVHMEETCTTKDKPVHSATTCAYMVLRGDIPGSIMNIGSKITIRERFLCILKTQCYLHADIGYICCFTNYGKVPLEKEVKTFREMFAVTKDGKIAMQVKERKGEVTHEVHQIKGRETMFYIIIGVLSFMLLSLIVTLAVYRWKTGRYVPLVISKRFSNRGKDGKPKTDQPKGKTIGTNNKAAELETNLAKTGKGAGVGEKAKEGKAADLASARSEESVDPDISVDVTDTASPDAPSASSETENE